MLSVHKREKGEQAGGAAAPQYLLRISLIIYFCTLQLGLSHWCSPGSCLCLFFQDCCYGSATFFFTQGFLKSSQEDSQVNTGKNTECLWEKKEAISGFSLKKRLPSAATFSWGKWFPAIFPSEWEWLSLLPQPVGGCSIKEVSAIPSPAVVKRRQEQPGCPHPSLPLCIQACPLVIWNQIILVTHQRS